MSTRDDAENTVIYFAVAGVLLALLGGVLAATQWPDHSGYHDDGNAVVAYLGAGLAGIGQLVLLVAVVAYGARLGVRWSGLLDPPPTAPAGPPSYLDEDGH